jgi:hypothetical protein
LTCNNWGQVFAFRALHAHRDHDGWPGQWELIQPLDDKSIFAQFTAATAMCCTLDEMLAAETKQGNELVLSGEFSG